MEKRMEEWINVLTVLGATDEEAHIIAKIMSNDTVQDTIQDIRKLLANKDK